MVSPKLALIEVTFMSYLDTTTASKTPDSWLRNSLDIVPKDLSVALGTALQVKVSQFAWDRLKAVRILLCPNPCLLCHL